MYVVAWWRSGIGTNHQNLGTCGFESHPRRLRAISATSLCECDNMWMDLCLRRNGCHMIVFVSVKMFHVWNCKAHSASMDMRYIRKETCYLPPWIEVGGVYWIRQRITPHTPHSIQLLLTLGFRNIEEGEDVGWSNYIKVWCSVWKKKPWKVNLANCSLDMI